MCIPPFRLIPKCLEKLRREKANLVRIFPVWPAQPWFPVLLELACDVPIIFRLSHDLLGSASGETHPPRGSSPAKLPTGGFFGVSGQLTVGRSTTLDTRHTSRRGETGSIGVFNGITIPC
jgi:hypothetical protein